MIYAPFPIFTVYCFHWDNIYRPGNGGFSAPLGYLSQILSQTVKYRTISLFFYRKLQHWHAWEAFSQQHNDRLLLTSSQLQVWYRWVKSNKAYCSFLQRECSRSVYSISLLSLSLPHASFKMKEDRKPLETTMTSPRRPDWCGWQAGQRKYLM